MSLRNLCFITFLMIFLAGVSYYYFDLYSLSLAIQINHHFPLLTKFAVVIQHTFTTAPWCLAVFLCFILLFWSAGSFKKFIARPATQFWLGLLLSMLFYGILKVFIGRYRPEMYFTDHLFGFSGFSLKDSHHSMPSGHSALIFSMATTLSYFSRSKCISFFLILLAVVLAATRTLVFRHYPSDVLMGALVGIWASYLAYFLCHSLRRIK